MCDTKTSNGWVAGAVAVVTVRAVKNAQNSVSMFVVKLIARETFHLNFPPCHSFVDRSLLSNCVMDAIVVKSVAKVIQWHKEQCVCVVRGTRSAKQCMDKSNFIGRRIYCAPHVNRRYVGAADFFVLFFRKIYRHPKRCGSLFTTSMQLHSVLFDTRRQ